MVEPSFYTVIPIVRITYGFFKIFMVAANLQFFATRIGEYGKTLNDDDVSKIIDIIFLIVDPFKI